MTTNIVCSDTYINAFSRLDKKTQKKSLETIRLMQRSLRSDSLKIEKLNTKLNFKSARVTQDFRAIFTQSGNTVLLVYIDHHDDAYLWASNRLQGFDAANIKPAYEYFEQSKKDTFDSLEDESIDLASSKKSVEPTPKPGTGKALEEHSRPTANEMPADYMPEAMHKMSFGLFSRLLYILLGIIIGIIIAIGHFMWYNRFIIELHTLPYQIYNLTFADEAAAHRF